MLARSKLLAGVAALTMTIGAPVAQAQDEHHLTLVAAGDGYGVRANGPILHQSRFGGRQEDFVIPADRLNRFTVTPARKGLPALVTRLIDRHGKPSGNASGAAVNIKTGDGDFLRFDETGTATTELEPGTYDVNVLSLSEDSAGTREVTAVTRQVEVSDQGGTTTIDARGAKPVTAKVDRPGATIVDSAVSIATRAGGAGIASTMFTGPGARVYAVPSKQVTDRQQVFVYRPTLAGKAFRYHLVHVNEGGLPDAPVYHVPDRRLARFDTTYYAQGLPGTSGVEGNNGKPAALPGLAIFRFFDLAIPGERIEYYTADPSVTWFNLRVLDSEAAYTNGVLRPGASRSTWFRPPVGTAWGDPAQFAGITRTGNELTLSVQPYAPSDGKRYQSSLGSGEEGKTVLLRDGKEIGATETVGSGAFTVPPEKGTYTLRTSGTRVAPYSNLDTTVLTEWTFDSAATSQATRLPVSLIQLGISPNALGQVRAGGSHELTLVADPQPGSTAARTRIPSVEVSFDDGKTWKRVPVGWGGQRGTAWVVAPRTPGFVSVRVSAFNTDGAKFTQTLHRAYELVG